jgi:RNA polymerase sigma-70 factor (ECF subfamily)
MQPRAPRQGDRHDSAISRSLTLLAKSGAASDHPIPLLTLDERDQITRAKQNPTAFGPLYERYVDAVYTYCARRVDDPEHAADLTAQIFTRALAALPRYREDGGSFRSWLFSIAHNTVIDSYRTRREHASIEAGDLGRTLAHPAPGPEGIALQRDLRDAFRAAMAELTDAQREVVAMRLAGLTGPEIASAARMSLAAVKSTQFRAYTRLRDLLSPYADTDPGKDSNDA